MMNNIDKKIREAYDSVTSDSELRDKIFINITDQIKFEANKTCYEKIDFKKRRFRKSIAIIASFFLILCVTSIGGYRYYFNETAYITIDVNPSIELSVNAFDKIIKTDSFNEDGAKILSDTNILHKNYNDAVAVLFQGEASAKFIDQGEYLLVTLQSSDKTKESIMLKNIETTVAHCKQKVNSKIQTQVLCANEETRQAAHHMQLSTGKYMAIKEAQSINPSITFEDCTHMTMREIKALSGAESNGKGKGNGYNKEHYNGHGVCNH